MSLIKACIFVIVACCLSLKGVPAFCESTPIRVIIATATYVADGKKYLLTLSEEESPKQDDEIPPNAPLYDEYAFLMLDRTDATTASIKKNPEILWTARHRKSLSVNYYITSGDAVYNPKDKRIYVVITKSRGARLYSIIYQIDPKKPDAVLPEFDAAKKLKNRHNLFKAFRKTYAVLYGDLPFGYCGINTTQASVADQALSITLTPPDAECKAIALRFNLSKKQWSEVGGPMVRPRQDFTPANIW